MELSKLLSDIWVFVSSSKWAIPTALFVYIGQKFIVPQVLELKDVVKRARYAVIYYANVFPIDQEHLESHRQKFEKSSKELRVISARLRSSRDNIPLYSIVEKTLLIPKWRDIENAAIAFIGWSNEIHSIDVGNSRQLYRKRAAQALGMKSY